MKAVWIHLDLFTVKGCTEFSVVSQRHSEFVRLSQHLSELHFLEQSSSVLHVVQVTQN